VAAQGGGARWRIDGGTAVARRAAQEATGGARRGDHGEGPAGRRSVGEPLGQ